jgi:Heparinase II/III-like protein/Heparinase II/III N-terminus
VKLQRVFRMGFAEVSCRARQEVSKWVDRRADPRRSALDGSIPAERSDRWLDEMVPHFFAGPSDPRLPALMKERLPDSVHGIVAAADRALAKRFDLLGYRDLSFGDPIDWHLDPVTKRQAPLRHWTLLDPLDAATVGDSKVVWELNRHQWLVGLGQAYRLTGDERYPAMFADTIRAWLRANPPGMGINWASSLEVAFRLISWCWALSLFHGAVALTTELRAALVGSITAHASRVERYMSYYFSPNTHLTGEALGLFYAGTLFPGMPDAARWRRLGIDILVREADRQILPDGVYIEQATCYQRYTAEIYLHFVILAARNGIPVPGGVIRRLELLLDSLLALRSPDGSLPQIGDADGGWLLPLEPRGPQDGRGVFALAAAALRRGDYAWASGGYTPEVSWLLGMDATRLFEQLESAPPTQSPSRLLPDGGYVVMRSGWGREADQIVFDTGPLGCRVSGGHGHADLLSIQASFRGQPYIVDPGTFRYTDDGGWRSHYRSTAAHSTVEIDQVGQAVPRGAFSWMSRPAAELTHWTSTATLDTAIAEHRAYLGLTDPVLHRRMVVLRKGRYSVVVDDLEGAAEHRVALRFQFAPMSVTLDPSGWIRAGRGSEHGLLLRAFSTGTLKATVYEGETDPKEGWISPAYGRQEPAPVVVYSLTTMLPVRVITLLLPTDALSAPAPAVLPVIENGSLSGLVLDDGGEVFRADGHPAHARKP